MIESIVGNPSLVFWGAIALICIVPAIAHYWWKVRRDELEAELKRSMVERGMSADEIVRVLEASKSGRESEG